FNALPTRTGGNLQLEASQFAGNVGSGFHTHLADVALQLSSGISGISPLGVDRIQVAGTTDDPGALGTLLRTGLPAVFQAIPFGTNALTNGFVATSIDILQS